MNAPARQAITAATNPFGREGERPGWSSGHPRLFADDVDTGVRGFYSSHIERDAGEDVHAVAYRDVGNYCIFLGSMVSGTAIELRPRFWGIAPSFFHDDEAPQKVTSQTSLGSEPSSWSWTNGMDRIQVHVSRWDTSWLSLLSSLEEFASDAGKGFVDERREMDWEAVDEATSVTSDDRKTRGAISLFAQPDPNGPMVSGATIEAVENVIGWLRNHADSTFATVADDGVISLSSGFQSGALLFIEVDRDGTSEATVAWSRSDIRSLHVSTVVDLTTRLMDDAVGSS